MQFMHDKARERHDEQILMKLMVEEHGMTDEQWFDEYFEVLDADDGTRLTTRTIHETLKANGFPHSEQTLAAWLNRHFQVRANGNGGWTFGHASVKKVNHQNRHTFWVCIALKA